MTAFANTSSVAGLFGLLSPTQTTGQNNPGTSNLFSSALFSTFLSSGSLQPLPSEQNVPAPAQNTLSENGNFEKVAASIKSFTLVPREFLQAYTQKVSAEAPANTPQATTTELAESLANLKEAPVEKIVDHIIDHVVNQLHQEPVEQNITIANTNELNQAESFEAEVFETVENLIQTLVGLSQTYIETADLPPEHKDIKLEKSIQHILQTNQETLREKLPQLQTTADIAQPNKPIQLTTTSSNELLSSIRDALKQANFTEIKPTKSIPTAIKPSSVPQLHLIQAGQDLSQTQTVPKQPVNNASRTTAPSQGTPVKESIIPTEKTSFDTSSETAPVKESKKPEAVTQKITPLTPTTLTSENGDVFLKQPVLETTPTADVTIKTTTIEIPSIEEQVSIQIKQATDSGQDEIEIKLNPGDLGTVNVKLDIVEEKIAKAFISVDNNDTLHLLKKDASIMVKSLEETGLQIDLKDIEFSLNSDTKDQDFAESEQQKNHKENQREQQQFTNLMSDEEESDDTNFMFNEPSSTASAVI